MPVNRGSKTRESTDDLFDEVRAKLRDIERTLDALRADADERPDPVGEAFAHEVHSLIGEAPLDAGVVQRAARLAVAEQAWEQRLGELLETRDVVELLSVTRQRVSVLARDHKLIALPQRGRLRFPAWQFAGTDAGDRACLGLAHRRLVEQGEMSTWSAASWFLTGHPELEDRDPVAWLREGGDHDRVLTAARRDAARAAQ